MSLEKNNLYFIINDSIHNSIFDSQILAPNLKRLKLNTNLKIALISFEKASNLNNKKIKIINNLHTNLKLIIFKKSFFFGRLSLYIQIFQLIKFFKTNLNNKNINLTRITSRGPLAGYILIKSLTYRQFCCILVQVFDCLEQDLKG